jgi:glycine cleavage system H lipoate-binding protein
MGGNQYVDIFATKGIEYLLVIGFLLTLIVFWRILNRSNVSPGRGTSASPPLAPPWFRIVDGLYFHQGHGWARVIDKETVVVGMDDFAQKLVGEMRTIHLPMLGEEVHQGTRAWDLIVESKTIPMRSPVSGQVVAINEKVLASPQVVNDDPYENGWLMKVRSRSLKNDVTNLLSGNLARAWMEQTVDALRSRSGGNLGIVLQDGGIPALGIAKNLSLDKWDEVAAEFLMSSVETDKDAPAPVRHRSGSGQHTGDAD